MTYLWAQAPLAPFTPVQSLPLAAVPALQLGVSVFTTLRSDTPHCWFRAHAKRLHTNASALFPETLPPFREFAEWLDALKAQHFSQSPPVAVRMTLLPLGLSLASFYAGAAQSPPGWGCLIEIREAQPLSPYPASVSALPVIQRVVLRPYEKAQPSLKHGSQLAALMLRREFATPDEEVAWVNARGELTELTHANLFVYHAQRGWVTPPARDCLAGVARQQVLKAAQAAGVEISEAPLLVDELPLFRAAFATNSVQGWRTIQQVIDNYGHSFKLSHCETLDALYIAWLGNSATPYDRCYPIS